MAVDNKENIPSASPDAATVLIVDDDPFNIEVVANFLKGFGWRILVARDGETAYKRSIYTEPDIILLDVMMPGIDGFDTCRRLKENTATCDIPVIFMTSLSDSEHKLKGFSVGAVDYVTKPIQKEELLARVTNHLKIYQYQEQLENKVRKRTAELEEQMTALKNEVAERKLAERALKNAQNFIADIINSMPSMVVGVDTDGRITQWNAKAEANTGILSEDATGRSLLQVCPDMENEIELINEAMTACEVRTVRKKARRIKDETLYEDITVYPLKGSDLEGAVIRVDNVTEQVHMEDMLIQSEKVLFVGGLAAGIAHEINNPLAGIMQTADVMGNRLRDTEMAANIRAASKSGLSMKAISSYMEDRGILRMLGSINNAGHRMVEIVENMLSFARIEESERSSHDMVEVLDKTLELAATDYDQKIDYDFKTFEIAKHYEGNLPLVPCEYVKIQQVIVNILRNGAQAMHKENNKNKKYRFIIRLNHEDETNMVRIEIEDNGPGMEDSVKSRVFEPFFTTKPVGLGTGLGLSVSYFIITGKHGGAMRVDSTPDKGSTFIIHLPL